MNFAFARLLPSLFCASILFAGTPELAGQTRDSNQEMPSKVEDATLGQTKNVHRCGSLFLAGQFTSSDIQLLKDSGIKRVITLRTDGEIDWDEKAALAAADMSLIEVPFRGPDTLTDEVFDTIRELLSDQETATLFHCGSANRVGGVWLPWRVLDEGVDLETALSEARTIGLRTEGYENKALDYIQRKSKERREGASSKSGINSSFLDPNLDVDAFVKRFEIDNREVYAARSEIIRAMNLKQGSAIADVGAGTGFYTRLFAEITGDDGWVFAVDIAPKFLEHIRQSTADGKLENVTCVLCQQDSIDLPANSVDVVYVCDTYHHFEFPKRTTNSIFRALKEGGELVVVDFERIPGKSRDWIIGHVRAGKKTVRAEIEGCGFQFIEEVEIPGLDENYFLRFKK